MQDIALSWLVYRLTGSAFLLGAIIFCKQIPNFLLSPLSGLLADRYNRHHIIIVTQTLAMGQAFLIAGLMLTGWIQVWQIFCLSLLLGIINAVDITARQAFIVDMVEGPEDLTNAIALNSITFNVARLVGPSVAGILLAMVGEGICFLINAVSFLGVLVVLCAMRISPKPPNKRHCSVFQDIREGCAYVYRFPSIKYIILLMALVSFMGLPYLTLMPIFATQVYAGNSSTLGLFMSAIGGGAICGATFLAARPNTDYMEKFIPFAGALFGGALLIFSQLNSVWLGVLTLFFAGLGMITQSASSNTLLQTMIDEDKRGRVMGFYSMAHSGMPPFGNLLAGFLAGQIGAPMTLFWGGVFCILGAVAFLRKLPMIQEYINEHAMVANEQRLDLYEHD